MRTRFPSLLGLAIALTLVAMPPAAQVRVDDLVRADVLDGGLTKRGTYLGALRLTLSDGWKTYWRAPGDAGIPPQFDWSRSQNLGQLRITWPTPHVFDQNGVQSIGYDTQVILPVEITPVDPDRPVRLRGKVELGICKDICVPGTLVVDHELDAGAGRNPAIAAALAQRPFSRKEAGVTSATCRLAPVADGMQIEARIAMPSAGGPEIAVIEPGSPRIWASRTDSRRDGGTLVVTSELIPVTDGPLAVDRSAVRITVLGQRHAVDIRGCTPG